MDGETNLASFFHEEPEFFHDTNFPGAAAASDLFSVLEAWEAVSNYSNNGSSVSASTSSDQAKEEFSFPESDHRCKKQKLNPISPTAPEDSGPNRVSHITVERNRRKQMNEHLAVLRSLMPCFYVKRGDQASIIGGVVDYIHELQQILHSLESKRQRKAYSEVLSPRPAPSPRKPPLSPRLSLPISPRTPQPSSPYKPSWMQQHRPPGYHLNSPSPVDRLPPPSPGCNPSVNSSVNYNDAVNELVATSKSSAAEVEVKFSGPNLLLKTVSHRIPGQAVRIVSALEDLALEILHLKISTVDQTMLNLFTIKIGIECQLSAEELAQQIQQTFC